MCVQAVLERDNKLHDEDKGQFFSASLMAQRF
jgi:hypothetical protein